MKRLVKTQDVDTALLEKYIENSGLRITFLCEKLGISNQSFHQKRNGKISFRASEVYVLCDLLKIPEDVKTKIFCLSG